MLAALSSRNDCDQFDDIAILQDLIIQDHFPVPRGDHRLRQDIDFLQGRKQCHARFYFILFVAQYKLNQICTFEGDSTISLGTANRDSALTATPCNCTIVSCALG